MPDTESELEGDPAAEADVDGFDAHAAAVIRIEATASTAAVRVTDTMLNTGRRADDVRSGH